MKNAVFNIRPYKWMGMWVFDDPRVGLVKEPFVAGIPAIIEEAVKGFENPTAGFTCLFNDTGLPKPTLILDKVDEESGGTWYNWRGTEFTGWLCPALLKYYPIPPQTLYIVIEP